MKITSILFLLTAMGAISTPAKAWLFGSGDTSVCQNIVEFAEKNACRDAVSGIIPKADDPAITICEAYIKRSKIKTPSTYRRLVAVIRHGEVRIVFDAQNEYGALMRGRYNCNFKFYDGSFHILNRTDEDYFISEVITIETLGDKGLTQNLTKLEKQ